jgi:hypothetical protein
MTPRQIFYSLPLLAFPILLATCTARPPASPAYDDSSKGKGERIPAPLEFQNGTATLSQAKAWHHSIVSGDEPVQSIEANLTPAGRPALCLYNPSNEGNGGHCYMVFEKTPRGLKYVGDIYGSFRAVPPDSSGDPRLVAYWHLGATGNRITLFTLTNGLFVVTAERFVDDHEGDVDNQLVADLFDSPAVSPEAVNRAFPIRR